MGWGAVWSAGYVVLATCIGAERRGRAFAIRTLFGIIGVMVAGAAVPSLILFANRHMAFFIVGLVGIVFTAVAMLFRDALRGSTVHQRRETENPETLRTASRTTMATIASTPVLLFLLALTFLGFSSIADHETLDESNEVSNGPGTTFVDAGLDLRTLAALALIFLVVGAILAALAGGAMADKVKNRERLVTICLVASAILLGIGALDIVPVPLLMWPILGGLAAILASPSIDLLVLKICPSGRIGAVFGFVSTGGLIGAALALWGSRGLTGSAMPETAPWLSALALVLCVISIYGAKATSR